MRVYLFQQHSGVACDVHPYPQSEFKSCERAAPKNGETHRRRSTDPAQTIHYAPAENLEHVDIALIDRAQQEIDMAAYVLTDWPVMQALTRAADRGVKVRIYLDGTQLAEREPVKVFNDLAGTPGVEIRLKHKTSTPMHLKSYQIDGRLLPTGAANFPHPVSSGRTMI